MIIKHLKAGQKAKVQRFLSGSKAIRQKLLALGLVPGAVFTLVRKAPFGDPVELNIRGVSFILRQDECKDMMVEPLSHA